MVGILLVTREIECDVTTITCRRNIGEMYLRSDREIWDIENLYRSTLVANGKKLITEKRLLVKS